MNAITPQKSMNRPRCDLIVATNVLRQARQR
jgi:hypothetical protein